MNKITREQEVEMRRQISPWMAARGHPMVLFDKLEFHKKVLLHNIVCVGKEGQSYRQLRELWDDFGLQEARGKGSPSNQVYEPTSNELEEYFSPQTSIGDIPYQKMY